MNCRTCALWPVGLLCLLPWSHGSAEEDEFGALLEGSPRSPSIREWTVGSTGVPWLPNASFHNSTLEHGHAQLLNGYNPVQTFWITSGGMVTGSLQSRDAKQSQRFTAPLHKAVTKVGLFWKTPYNTEWAPPPHYKVGIQEDRLGFPSGRWVNGTGYGIVAPTGWDEWHFVSLGRPVDLEAELVYHVVVEWHSGLIDSAHFNNVYVNSPTDGVVPLNVIDADRNRNIVDRNLAVLTYRDEDHWRILDRRTMVFLLGFADGTHYGQPYAHGYQGLADKSKAYYRERIKIEFQDKTVETIGSMLGIRLDFITGESDEEKWAKLHDVHYEIWDAATLLRTGVLAYKNEIRDHFYNCHAGEDRRFAWYERKLTKPLRFEKNKTYTATFFSPGTVDASYLVDAPEVRPFVNPRYPYDGPSPFAKATWGGEESHFERWKAEDGYWKDDGKRRDVSLKFKLAPVKEGTITSIAKDAELSGSAGDVWKEIEYSGGLPSGTSVGIAVAGGSCEGYVIVQDHAASGTAYVLPVCARGRYLNWRLTLRTDDSSVTPTVHSVTLRGAAR